jgi:hypothetical protein
MMLDTTYTRDRFSHLSPKQLISNDADEPCTSYHDLEKIPFFSASSKAKQ